MRCAEVGLGALLLLWGGCGGRDRGFPFARLRVGGVPIRVEVASKPGERFRGFRFRGEVPAGTGMIFLFPDPPEYHAFVMTDTTVPLSIAFADSAGTILQIEHMEPLARGRFWSRHKVSVALEVPRGWFEENGVGEGARIEGLAQLLERHPPR